MNEVITFAHSETEKVISIQLCHNDIPPIVNKDEEEENEEEEEEEDVVFKIVLEGPQPQGVKISKKNVCFVTITKSEQHEKDEDDKQKLL
jgi:hypothetical protein